MVYEAGGGTVSRKGQLWQGDLAQHIEEQLIGVDSPESLLEWALDHPFFDDRDGLDPAEQTAIARALGLILQASEGEPAATRTSRAQLEELALSLWRHPGSGVQG